MVPLIILILWLLPLSAQATTYYVSTSGSNSNNGTDVSTPFLTVAYCVSTMVAGDTCYVRAGTYNESVIRFGRSGTSSAPITLMNYPGEAPKIDFISSANNDRILIQNTSGANVAIGWLIIQGLELTDGHDGIKYQNLHDSIIRNNWIHGNAFMGILGIGGARILFERNIIHHNGRIAACDAGTTTLCSGPTSITSSPGLTWKSTASRARNASAPAPNTLPTPRASIASVTGTPCPARGGAPAAAPAPTPACTARS